jgi:ethanolaminephosphotransferase
VVSPLAALLVGHVIPVWVAPNVITFFAFSLNVAAHVMVWSAEETAAWNWFLSAFFYFCYQVLDNADGKQARKINASSPLGMLVDHGCDALSMVILSQNLLKILDFGDDYWPKIVLMSVSLAGFFMTTLEEYVVGSMELPIVNAPNEGILAIMVLSILEGFYPKFMSSVVANGVQAKYVFFWIHSVSGSTVSLFNLKAIAKKTSFVSICLYVAPFFLMLLAGFGWVATHPEIFKEHELAAVWLVGLGFSKLVFHLQLAHISDEQYFPWRKTLFVVLVITLANVRLHIFNADQILYIGLLIVFVSWVHLVVSVSNQILKALDIHLLTVKAK